MNEFRQVLTSRPVTLETFNPEKLTFLVADVPDHILYRRCVVPLYDGGLLVLRLTNLKARSAMMLDTDGVYGFYHIKCKDGELGLAVDRAIVQRLYESKHLWSDLGYEEPESSAEIDKLYTRRLVRRYCGKYLLQWFQKTRKTENLQKEFDILPRLDDVFAVLDHIKLGGATRPYLNIWRNNSKDHDPLCILCPVSCLVAWKNREPTPLHSAAAKGDLVAVQLLVEAGENPDATDRNDLTPLHMAADKGRLEVTQFLVEKAGANLDAEDDEGWTPLHTAAYKGRLEVTQFLVEKADANLDAEDYKGRTPLSLASSNGQLHVEQFLEKIRADRKTNVGRPQGRDNACPELTISVRWKARLKKV
jgi:hypothetical protein